MGQPRPLFIFNHCWAFYNIAYHKRLTIIGIYPTCWLGISALMGLTQQWDGVLGTHAPQPLDYLQDWSGFTMVPTCTEDREKAQQPPGFEPTSSWVLSLVLHQCATSSAHQLYQHDNFNCIVISRAEKNPIWSEMRRKLSIVIKWWWRRRRFLSFSNQGEEIFERRDRLISFELDDIVFLSLLKENKGETKKQK